MKNQHDYALDLLQKAQNDLFAANTVITTGQALDTVCFHAQQAAEKSLKALLAAEDIPFPKRHDIGELVTLLESRFPTIGEMRSGLISLTPYAVEMRYDNSMTPDHDEAADAISIAERVFSFATDYIGSSENS